MNIYDRMSQTYETERADWERDLEDASLEACIYISKIKPMAEHAKVYADYQKAIEGIDERNQAPKIRQWLAEQRAK